MSLPVDVPGSEALGLLSRFRVEFYECLYARVDALFELTDAVLLRGRAGEDAGRAVAGG